MTNDFWREFWGNPARRSNPYGTYNTIYAKNYHRGEDVTTAGTNLDVPALRSGLVAAVYRQTQTGFSVAIDVGQSRYDIYCHMFEADAVKSGWVNAGDRVGRMARANEQPGTSWGGAHVHFVVSDNPAGADALYADYDPRPIIDAALAAPPGTSTPPTLDMSSEDEMIRISAANRGIAVIGPGYFRQLTSTEEVQAAEAIVAKTLEGNDRQFDLWRSIAMDGTAK